MATSHLSAPQPYSLFQGTSRSPSKTSFYDPVGSAVDNLGPTRGRAMTRKQLGPTQSLVESEIEHRVIL